MCECCGTEKSIYLPQMATVNKTRLMNGTEMYLHLSTDEQPMDYMPGQFVEVSVAGIGEAPISISSSPTQKDGFELVECDACVIAPACDLTRALDEAQGLDHPRIWTAERDREMWAALEG